MFKNLLRLIFRHRDEVNRRRTARHIGTVSFLFGFTDSFFAYVLSMYFASVTGSDNVGGFYLATFAVFFPILWFLHFIIRRVGGSVRLFLLALVAALLLSSALSVIPANLFGAIAAAALLLAVNVAWVALDVALEQVSDDGVTGRLRGMFLTVMNAGVLLAPFFATRVVERAGFGGVFFGVTVGLSVVLAASILLLRSWRDGDSSKIRVRSAWKKMLREHDLFHIYSVAFGLDFFYIMTMIYTPIHLYQVGFSWDEIGLLLTIMLLPFIFLQYPLGVLADKRLGEREILIGSVTVSILSVAAFALFPGKDFLFWGVILFTSRIGAAGMEVMRDSYFYKHVDGGDSDLIALFRTTKPLANVLGAVVAIPFLFFFPLPAVFALTAVVMLPSLYSAFALHDTR